MGARIAKGDMEVAIALLAFSSSVYPNPHFNTLQSNLATRMNPNTYLMHTSATSNFPEEIPARRLEKQLGRRQFLSALGGITSVFALGMAPLMANPGNPAWDAALRELTAAHLARPSANQYAWHEQECTMFVFGVPTWEGTEYDAEDPPILQFQDFIPHTEPKIYSN